MQGTRSTGGEVFPGFTGNVGIFSFPASCRAYERVCSRPIGPPETIMLIVVREKGKTVIGVEWL
ncbi:MAG TPA: hypothetical protein VMW63_07625 [Methanoregulaceae archaeon]|nr:hypothetical protein [Methanoregulaceae archaeon]